ncbi:hypothetical protein QQS21_009446 [Conoideocrella luteorostrata]|uniref:Uncharacterized protein n=1 Tax=Conoideocrella luteorostrata TaxID=1105319 RepID=A0AAJ0FVM2_9HYPO|nr:hypothetical protein QQS21_009446 [Conoideocrella luteorostrata]
MGNICGKEDNTDPQPPGRILGSAPPTQRKSSVPASKKVGGPPRTLGGGGGGGGTNSATSEASASSFGKDASDARRKAAEAAEARAKASNKPGGKLQTQLTAQKKQSRNDTLKAISAEGQRAKDIAQNEDRRTYN